MTDEEIDRIAEIVQKIDNRLTDIVGDGDYKDGRPTGATKEKGGDASCPPTPNGGQKPIRGGVPNMCATTPRAGVLPGTPGSSGGPTPPDPPAQEPEPRRWTARVHPYDNSFCSTVWDHPCYQPDKPAPTVDMIELTPAVLAALDAAKKLERVEALNELKFRLPGCVGYLIEWVHVERALRGGDK